MTALALYFVAGALAGGAVGWALRQASQWALRCGDTPAPCPCPACRAWRQGFHGEAPRRRP